MAAVGFLGSNYLVSKFSHGSAEVLESPSTSSSGAYYRYCSDARAAGAAPLYLNDPGYRVELDRDGDGVACEPYIGN